MCPFKGGSPHCPDWIPTFRIQGPVCFGGSVSSLFLSLSRKYGWGSVAERSFAEVDTGWKTKLLLALGLEELPKGAS